MDYTGPPTTPAPSSKDLTDLDEMGARIPFGNRPNQTMPPTWAADMLTLLCERHSKIFRDLLGEVATGERTLKRGGGQ